MKINPLRFLFLLFYWNVLQAQSYNIESLTIADGLSQGMIYDIEQTDDGFLWFATKDGLNRYDGYNFEVFTHDPFEPYSIAGNDIYKLFEDSRGNLWISVIGVGCDVLEKSSGRFLHLSNFEGIPGNLVVNNIDESPDGTVWIGINGGLLSIRWNSTSIGDLQSQELTDYATVSLVTKGTLQGKNIFKSVDANSNHSILVYIEGDGVYQYDPAGNSLSLLHKEDNAKHAVFMGRSAPGKTWISFIENNDKVLVVENGKLIEFPNWKHLPYAPVGLLSDGIGNIFWSRRDKNYTYIYSMPETEAMNPASLTSPTLIAKLYGEASSMNLDRGRNLWIGMSGYGLRKIKLARQPFEHFLAGQSVRRILSADKIYLWLAGTSETWLLNEQANVASLASAPLNGIFEYYVAKSGSAYIITDELKFYYYQDHNNLSDPLQVLKFPGHEYTPIIEDQEGVIWAGGEDAIVMRFDPARQHYVFLDLSDSLGKGSLVYSLHADHQQNLWIGTTNGMARVQIPDLVFEKATHQITQGLPVIYKTDPGNSASLRYNFITSFCDDPSFPDKWLWLSTKGGGISILEKATGTFNHFTVQNSGLPNDVVYGMLPDDYGNIWMSTNRGLSRMTCLPAFYEHLRSVTLSDGRDHELIFQNFRESDGLQSDEFNTSSFYRIPDGRLMFGGVNGLTAFFPEAIKERQTNAAVHITDIKINNHGVDYFQEDRPLSRPIHLTNGIVLRHDQNLVTLEFALMDFVTPEENRFRYKLHGVDPDWVNAGNYHTANYAQLRPGDYQFEVQGNIGYGNWSASATLGITILPPWWASWWAYSTYFILLMAVAYAIFYFFKKRIRLQQELKMKFEEANRLKELDTFKSQVYTNLTHEFRTPLTVILGMTNQLEAGTWQNKMAEKDKGKVSNALKLIENNGKNLLRLINQLLDLSKLESKSFKLQLRQSDIVPYLRYVTESFQSYANGQNLSLRFYSSIETLMMDFDPEQIKQVVTNLISNALKFTSSGGNILVKLTEVEGRLGIQVTDTGIGIAQEDLPYIFDRFYQTDNTTTRVAQGTGIGLAHTQELVKLMGGTISVESEIGRGTSMYVHLPITNNQPVVPNHVHITATGLSVPMSNPMLKEEMAAESDTTLPQMLIIEDNPDVVTYLKSCLENEYQIMVAYNGIIGIDKAIELIPDFIISDVMMPEKDGYQVCDALKNDERTSHIPIILLTAKADAASRLAGLRRGADAYLAKPFNVEELLLQISVLLDNRRRLATYFSKALKISQEPPHQDSGIVEAIEIEDAFISKVKGIIEANYGDENFSLPQLCLELGMSRSQLFRKMKAVTDTSPSDLIRTYRLTKARTLLQNGHTTVAEATYHVGFKDPSYFSKIFFEEFGILPGSISK